MFASNFARNMEERNQSGIREDNRIHQSKSPHYARDYQQKEKFNHNDRQNQGRTYQPDGNKQHSNNNQQEPVPMDIDPSSSKFRQQTHHTPQKDYRQAFKRQNTSERRSGQQRQRINHLAQNKEGNSDDEYRSRAESEALEVNFLGLIPCSRSYNGQ